MAERPILFSCAMVRAILDGRKTQTRRVVKHQPPDDCGTIFVESYHPTKVDRNGDEYPGEPVFGAFSHDGEWGTKCPYGQPGDRLWVRETWAVNPYTPETRYRATDELWTDCGPLCWRPSIHMPRLESRINLEITAVRVERLNDINCSDAAAEGVQVPCDEDGRPLLRLTGLISPAKFLAKPPQEWTAEDFLRFEYAELWEQINGPGSWATDPWVWVVAFSRVPS